MRFDKVKYEASYGTAQQLPKSEHTEIAFAGRSNVGKSSMLNKILNRKNLARVSSVPGKTVTVNFYKLDGLRLVDLPGYGYAKVDFKERQRWAELMEGYFKSGRNIPLVFQLIDSRHPATDFDISILDFLSQMEIPYVIILTKCDKLNKTEFNTRMSSIYEELGELAEGVEIIPTSAQNGKGCEQIREIISQIYDGVEG